MKNMTTTTTTTTTNNNNNNSHIRSCAHASESTNVKVQNIYRGK